MGYLVRWRDSSRALQGVVPFDRLELVLRHNAAGTWSLDLDGASEAAGWIAPGGGVVVAREEDPGTTLLSGPVRGVTEATSEGSPHETLTVSGIDDTGRLAQRLVYPTPAAAITAQTTLFYTQTALLETVLRDLVDLNAGPNALVARRIPGLVLGANYSQGATTSVAYRLRPLLERLTELGNAGGLGFRVVQVGTTLEFQVYTPTDRSGTAKFSRALGNLRTYSYGLTAPEMSTAIVGGSGEGVSRIFVERINASAETDWGDRFEGFVDDKAQSDGYLLQDTGDRALVEGGPRASLSIDPIDTPDLAYGTHYGLGDKVTVLTNRGSQIVDVVREVHISVTADGTEVRPVVGTPSAEAEDADQLYALVRELTKRVRQLEQGS